jgi:MFS family permease
MNFLETKDSIENASVFLDLEKLKLETPETKSKEREDKIALIFIWIYTGVESAATTMVNPLIPAEAIRHDVDQIVLGMLFFIFSLSSLTTSLFLGKIQSYLGRRNIILVAFILKIFTYLGFIVISSVKTKLPFILLFGFLHITQGISASWYQTAAYSSLTIMFPEKVDYVISCFETFSGIGFSFGPAIGSILFAYGGYTLPFYVFLVILTCMTFLTNYFLPEHLNNSKEEDETDSDVNYLTVLKNKRILFAWIILAMNSVTYDFLNPILSDVMDTFYGMNEDMVGWMFWLMGVGYIVSCQMTNFSLRFVSNRRLVTMSLISNGIFLMFLGPSKILGTSPHLWVTCFGLFFSGASSAHFVVPVYSEILEAGKHEMGIDEQTINDLASGLSTTVVSLGQMFSYSVGGYVYEKAGFSSTIDLTAITVFVVAAWYFIWWDKSMLGSKDFVDDEGSPYGNIEEASLKESLVETI